MKISIASQKNKILQHGNHEYNDYNKTPHIKIHYIYHELLTYHSKFVFKYNNIQTHFHFNYAFLAKYTKNLNQHLKNIVLKNSPKNYYYMQIIKLLAV